MSPTPPPLRPDAPPGPDRIVREAAAQICASLDLGNTLWAIVDAAKRALGAERATCYVNELDRQVVEAVYTTEADPRRRRFLEAARGRGPEELPIWRAQLGREDPILVVEDVAGCADIDSLLAGRLGAGAFLGARLEHGSLRAGAHARLLGTLFCTYRHPRCFSDEERSIAGGLANLASLGLANARLHDTTLQSLAAAELRAETDPLTGLVNRWGLERRMEEIMAAAGPETRLSVLMLDLDGFKQINDRNGHLAGDACLRAVARALKAGLRADDLVGRVGGEEFLALLPGTGTSGAWLVAERLRGLVGALAAPDGTRLSASLGVAARPEHGRSLADLQRAADTAMYEAKAGGRDRSVVYSPRRARSRARQARSAQTARESYLRSVEALAAALDERDPRTHTHSATVAAYAAAIGGRLGLDGDRVEQLRVAGLLHDVGKVGVSDAVLQKPGPLTDEERAEMRRHPEIGAKILVHPDLAEVRAWVLCHHERPDGRGYPAGLPGAQIPLEALIIGVADAYEAMTSARPYRGPLGPERARAELEAGRGSQFAPAAVDAFLGWLDERPPAPEAAPAAAARPLPRAAAPSGCEIACRRPAGGSRSPTPAR